MLLDKNLKDKRFRTEFEKAFLEINLLFISIFALRGSAVGWDTALQAGRSRVQLPMGSVEPLIDSILPFALWRCSRLIV
jgi:hypothetical protein